MSRRLRRSGGWVRLWEGEREERNVSFLSVGWWGLEDFLESTIVVTSVLGESE